MRSQMSCMRHLARRALLLVCLALVPSALLPGAVTLQYQQTPSSGSEVCDDSNRSDECQCIGIVDSGNCALDGPEKTWGTQCDRDGCLAWTNCGDGVTVTCHGDYKAVASSVGVLCKDTGTDPGTVIYCPGS